MTRHLADIGPWRVLKSGHVTITKIENLHIGGTRIKIHWYQKCYSFRSMTKNNEVIVEKPFQNSGITRRLWRFQHATVLERSIEVGFSFILSIYKVVYINKKRLIGLCRVCGNMLEKFDVKFAKNAELDWSKSHEWWRSDVYNSASKQGRRSFSSLYIITCCIYIASNVCSNTCRGFAVRWCWNLQKLCPWKFNEQYIERDS